MRSAATVVDVARIAGVSAGTVSNALNRPEIVAAATRQRVQEAISAISYQAKRRVRARNFGNRQAVGVIAADGEGWYWREFVRGAESEALDRGVSVLNSRALGHVDREEHFLDILEEHRVRGILISPSDNARPRLQTLAERGIPSVFIDRLDGEGSWSSVMLDNVDAGRGAAQHLLSRGWRNLLFIGDPDNQIATRDRMHGARDAVESSNSGARLNCLSTDDESVGAGIVAARTILARSEARPDAVLAATDDLAIGLLHTLLAAGISIPFNMGVIGFDDSPFASTAAVPLSTMRVPARTIGKTAMRLLLDTTSSEVHVHEPIVFHAELVARESTWRRW